MAPKHLAAPLFLLAPMLLVAACDTIQEVIDPPPVEEIGLWLDADAGVEDERLSKLCRAVWETRLRRDPIQATYLGDPRFHGDLPNNSERGRTAHIEELQQIIRRAGLIDAAKLSAEDRLTHELLLEEVEKQLALVELGLERWTVDPVRGPMILLLNLVDVQPIDTPRQRDQLVDRWAAVPGFLRVASFNLRSNANQGWISSKAAVIKALSQVDAFLTTHPMECPLVTIATGGGRWVELPPEGNVAELAHDILGDARHQKMLRRVNLHLQEDDRIALGTRVLLPADDDALSSEERGRFLYAVLKTVEDDVYPAVAAYRNVLMENILPRARSNNRPGLLHVRGGEQAYRTMIRHHTTLPPEECDPQAIHELGLSEVARIRAEMSELGQRVFGTGDVAEIQRLLREDPAMHFASRDEVQAKAVESLHRAQGVMSRFFGILPQARCEVVAVPAHAERDSTIAWYEPPAADGSRPGTYYINTSLPETRPRYEAEVLAYHEAIPGHHLQIAIAQELEGVPLFRRHMDSTAYVEGWALYTERLCDEMGLYSDDLDRFGMLSFDAWRACRLVVDTGIHAFGWSRKQAIDYMIENTLLAPNNIENEVDRYIAWPGQALAYKLGQQEILTLRDEAREALGERFDYPAFHDAVLASGPVSLPRLRANVAAWAESQ
ncbi:MAG: DUF885 domain-containing protein [Planctomycetota bacterium]|nr:DUF885 domain-containing protein [Planctomycetota bacterium]